ncbi:MAG TPA: hypothetical protein VMG10_08920 [Gemmataceae bacterium]|nr:hypothetical protein [Gemmataceae bacterium]
MRSMRVAAIVGILFASTARAAEWRPITTELLRTAKPGYGGLSGVVVDHRTGHLYVDVSDRGIYRSTNEGVEWQSLGETFKGRTEWPGCLMIDPVGDGKRMLIATVYGAPVARGSIEGGWKFADKKSAHVDWCAADWSDPRLRFLLALKHESGGLLIVSHDGGDTFAEIGKGYGPAWIFDHDTAVVARMKTKEQPKAGLLRTTDGGKTFQPCGDYTTHALPRWHDGRLYWLVEGALLSTADKGEHWSNISDLKDGRFGPIFGKDAKHLFVLTGAGIVESTDAGKNWSKPIAPPRELKGVSALTWMEYDPKNDVLYIMKMGSELYKMLRK